MQKTPLFIGASKSFGVLLFSLCLGTHTIVAAASDEVVVERDTSSTPQYSIVRGDQSSLLQIDQPPIARQLEESGLPSFDPLQDAARGYRSLDVSRLFSERAEMSKYDVKLPELVRPEDSAASAARFGSLVDAFKTPKLKLDIKPVDFKFDFKPTDEFFRLALDTTFVPNLSSAAYSGPSPYGASAFGFPMYPGFYQSTTDVGYFGAPAHHLLPLAPAGFFPPFPQLEVSPFPCGLCHNPGPFAAVGPIFY